ncbi:hypothetical protein D3C77_253080 [compost metagenome]
MSQHSFQHLRALDLGSHCPLLKLRCTPLDQRSIRRSRCMNDAVYSSKTNHSLIYNLFHLLLVGYVCTAHEHLSAIFFKRGQLAHLGC